MKSIKKGNYITNKILYKIFIKNKNKNLLLDDICIFIYYIFKKYNIYLYNGKYIYKFNSNIFNDMYIKIKFYNLIK